MPESSETAPPAAETPADRTTNTDQRGFEVLGSSDGPTVSRSQFWLCKTSRCFRKLLCRWVSAGRVRWQQLKLLLQLRKNCSPASPFVPIAADDTDAKPADLYEVGTLVMIKRMERADNGMRIIAQGTERIRVVEWKQEDPFLRAVVEILPEPRIVDAGTSRSGQTQCAADDSGGSGVVAKRAS